MLPDPDRIDRYSDLQNPTKICHLPAIFSEISYVNRYMLDPISEGGGVAETRKVARQCKNCPLWKSVTQTVFGKGKSSASTMIVGEQPEDCDLHGRDTGSCHSRLTAPNDAREQLKCLCATCAIATSNVEQRAPSPPSK